MTPARLVLTAALLASARADTFGDAAVLNSSLSNNTREVRAYDIPTSCLYDGKWHEDGDTVATRQECLRCVCVRGALSCRRRACSPLPDPLPRRCHVRHRRGACCPELHCPDGVKIMEHGAVARFESDESTDADFSTPSSANRACVEGGTVFAAGSALVSGVACEQCFCLRGVRRCVRPTCLPPPPHCAPRPAAGACCPQRYYCDRNDAPVLAGQPHKYDCMVNNTWVSEGDSVASRGNNCTSCFCLRGQVRCQAMHCAPPLAGCRPLLALGDCCAHQYICEHSPPEALLYRVQNSGNLLPHTRHDQRAFHTSQQPAKIESTTKKLVPSYTQKHTSMATATKNHLITTTKVKRKTEEPTIRTDQYIEKYISSTTPNVTSTQNLSKLDERPTTDSTTENSTEQPEGTIKIVINGTINCTAELSSTSLPLSISNNSTDNTLDVLPRIPVANVEAHTYSPNDIITDRNVNGGFDENDTFTINVTSSLITNTSHSTSRPATTVTKASGPLVNAVNSSVKDTKEDYDYDYAEPTLPPSLPNLKIIPFVAADAVVDDEQSKDDIITYPMRDKQNKFPVYYPPDTTKKATFSTRREDAYQPTQYPVFISEKVEPSYSAIGHDVDLSNNKYSETNGLAIHEYKVSTSLGSHANVEPVTTPSTTTTFAMDTPIVNLFSPPIETEGGFIPKGPGIIDEYYAVYPSTPSGPTVPNLTTSMQLDIVKSKCLTKTGEHVLEGESITMGCLVCTCSWVELSCVPRACSSPPTHCERLPPTNHSHDPCCGELVCKDKKNTSTPVATKENDNVIEPVVEVKNESMKYSGAIPVLIKTIPAEMDEVNIEQSIAKNITINNATNPLIPKPESMPTTKIMSTAQFVPTTKFMPTTKTVSTTQFVPTTKFMPTTKSVSSPQFQPSSKYMPTTTTVAPTITAQPIPKITTTTTTRAPPKLANDSSQEYDDGDDDFSFGSVLKLLLSDSFESTTAAPVKKTTTRPRPRPTVPIPTSTVAPFIPLPSFPYNVPKASYDRIDHLLLGEATAIKRTTKRPITNKPTTQRWPDDPVPFTSAAYEGSRPPNRQGLPSLDGIGSGLLKISGCNIYGRMYRVGRIITELTTPCQECRCTELGVQCKPLAC